MGYSDQFFKALGLNPESRKEIRDAAELADIPLDRFKYYNDRNIVPSGNDLTHLEDSFSINELELKLKMGRLDHDVIEAIQVHAEDVYGLLEPSLRDKKCNKQKKLNPVFKTKQGKLYEADCLRVLGTIKNDTVDLIFADPPFNLDKIYPSSMDDNLKEEEYLKWTESWLKECTRVLKPGGALFLWNLPVWNSKITSFLHSRLTFKHWIASDIKYSLPIPGKLYPSHYSLLYYVNGKRANTFLPDRLPTPTCPKCFGDLKDYGGYKHKMNPNGVNLTDVWIDIPPVRHAKYKKRQGSNELSVRLLDRIIEMASKKGDVILDPFGGSGTTYVVAELKKRKWIGCELGPCDIIIDRFTHIKNDKENLDTIRSNLNHLFTPAIKEEREKRKLWTSESAIKKAKERGRN